MRARFALCTVFALLLPVAMAQAQTLNDPADVSRLGFEEKRVLQSALALSGNYLGLLDGDWGRGSERALSIYTAEREGRVNATYGTLAALLTDFGNEVAANDWQMIYLESVDVSYAHPLNLLIESADKSVMQFDAADDSFSVSIDYSDRTGATAVHAYIFGQGVQNPPPYQNYSDDRLISSVTLPGGLLAYVRSDWVGDGFVTFSIIAADQHRERLALIAGSLQRGRAPQFVLPPNGRLAQVLTNAAGTRVTALPDTNPFDRIDPNQAPGLDPNPLAGEEAVVLPPDVTGPTFRETEPQPEDVTIDPGTLLDPPVEETDPFANEGTLDEVPEPPQDDWNSGNFSSSGTGFYINRDYLVTAAHVVEGCARMELTDRTALEVIRSEPDLDLAVLKVPGDVAVLFEPGESDVWLKSAPS